MNGPVLLDLYCGAGGASVGYHRAGFQPVGVDKVYQSSYPYQQITADLAEMSIADLVREIDVEAVHASPPCHDHSDLAGRTGHDGTGWLLVHTRAQLENLDLPYVIENVQRAEMRADLTLCGSMFGLGAVGRVLKRHRKFESNVPIGPQPVDQCKGQLIGGVYGTGSGGQNTRGFKFRVNEAKEAMGIDWMLGREMSQAIPPAYTEFVGARLMSHLRVERAA